MYALIVVPILLIIALVIFNSFNSSGTLGATITTTGDEDVNFAANNTAYALAHPHGTTVTGIYNDTSHHCALPSTRWVNGDGTVLIYTNSTVGSTATCPNDATSTGNYTTGNWYVTYTHQNDNANTTAANVASNTSNGFNLGALLPFVLIAVVLIGVILGALGGIKA